MATLMRDLLVGLMHRSAVNASDKSGFVRFDLNDDLPLQDASPGYHPSMESKESYGFAKQQQPNCELGEQTLKDGISKEIMDEYNKENKKSAENMEDKISGWQAGWNVTNAIQGMFIVCFPYAVLQGGVWGLLTILLVAYICCYTGKALVDCLYEKNDLGEMVRVRATYVDIAEEVWGRKIGGRIVNCAQLLELLMTCILYMVLCGDLMIGSFPQSSIHFNTWVALSCTLMIPCAFLSSLRHVSIISLWNTITHVIINAIVIAYCISRASEWHFQSIKVTIDVWTFPISLGIIIFSYTSHIFLPSLEGSVVDRRQFPRMLYVTHLLAAIFKTIFGLVGFLTFGNQTDEVITNNLTNSSLRVVVNIALFLKSLLSYPLPYYATVKLLETSCFQGGRSSLFSSCYQASSGNVKLWAIAAKIGLIFITYIMAICIPHFAILMGLIGSFTGTMLSFVWPAYFHLQIKRHSISMWVKIWDVIIIVLGTGCGLVGIYYSAHALNRVMHGQSINPFQKSPYMPILQKIVPGSNTTALLFDKP